MAKKCVIENRSFITLKHEIGVDKIRCGMPRAEVNMLLKFIKDDIHDRQCQSARDNLHLLFADCGRFSLNDLRGVKLRSQGRRTKDFVRP